MGTVPLLGLHDPYRVCMSDPIGCQVHSAALESRAFKKPDPLLLHIGVRDVVPECSTCPFCRQALECIRIHRTSGGKPDQEWQRLWYDSFPGVD